jgi:prepilin-type N-terminal cleavage/methylation domain-containing protein
MRISLSACPCSGKRRGFSLLEVVLALAILTDSTQAQLLCEAKMDEIAAGITSPDPVQQVPFDCVVGDGDVGWVYSITQELTEEQGLDLVCVTVAQDLPLERQPVSFSLYRWIPDPTMQAAAESAAESASQDSATGGSSE